MRKFIFLLVVLLGISFGAFANGQSDGSIVVGVTLETFDDVFMQNVLDSVNAEADKLGVKIVATDAKSDPVEQLKQIDNFITSDVDAIIVHVINPEIAKTITKKAVDAGVPLVYMNRSPNDSDVPQGKMVAVVASPEIKAGEGQAEFVIKKLGTKGNAAILLGGIGSGPQIGRTKGVKDYLAKNAPGLKVIKEQTANWNRPEALSVVENWLATGDKLDVIFANNDEMAIGASKALQEKGLKDSVLVVGVDASPDGIAALEAGEMDMTMFQNGSAQGTGSVDIAVKMVKGESFNQKVEIPFEPVTKENASEYK